MKLLSYLHTRRVLPPVGDTIDRLTILGLTDERAPQSCDRSALHTYRNLFESDSRLTESERLDYFNQLKALNGQMWELESVIRSPGGRDLADVGRAAIELRNLNSRRNRIKAQANEVAFGRIQSSWLRVITTFVLAYARRPQPAATDALAGPTSVNH